MTDAVRNTMPNVNQFIKDELSIAIQIKVDSARPEGM